MSNWTSTIHPKGDLIVFKVQDQNTERKQWFAELTELDDEYRFKRDFIAYAEVGESDSGHVTSETGMIVEHADGESRTYYEIDEDAEGRLNRIDADEAELLLLEG